MYKKDLLLVQQKRNLEKSKKKDILKKNLLNTIEKTKKQ